MAQFKYRVIERYTDDNTYTIEAVDEKTAHGLLFELMEANNPHISSLKYDGPTITDLDGEEISIDDIVELPLDN